MKRSLLENTINASNLGKFYYEVVKEPRRWSASISYNEKLYRFQETGDDRDRTGDLWLAKPPLSQLSYIPKGSIKWA